MTNSAIVSYAILKTNWEQPEHRDYLDNFMLIVAEAIRQLTDNVISLSELQKQISLSFSLYVPQNTIKSILNRAKKHGYVKVSKGIYRKNDSVLEKINFREIQHRVLQAHEVVVGSLTNFALKAYQITWTNEQAEEALQAYLIDHQVLLLGDLLAYRSRQTQTAAKLNHKYEYIVAKYIDTLRENHMSELDYLETVIKGNLLANAVFMTDPGTYQRKFRGTTVYLDTSLIMYALGHAGEPRKLPILELITLLKSHGAHLRIFRHSLEEIIGILSALAERIRLKDFQNSYGPSLEYFIEKGYSETDVMMFIENLEVNLCKHGILISERPPYTEHEYVINEDAYSSYLKSKVTYKFERALERDKDSIVAIFRLRRGEIYIAIEESSAIFVTSNRDLAYSTRDYSEFNYYLGIAPLCVTDYEMTNLVWLKDPHAAPGLPRKRLIADCYAAIQPSNVMWTKYLSAISDLEQQGTITNEDYFVLRHSIQAKSELMNRTFGDETVFSEGTVFEILTSVKNNIRASEIDRANAEALAKEDALIKLENERDERVRMEVQIQQGENARKERIRQRAKRGARAIMVVTTVLLLIIFVYLTYATSELGPLSISATGLPAMLRIIALLIFWGLLILQALNLVIGFMPKILLDRFEPKIANWIENLLTTE